jgi:plasmid stabilization system protein ParE
MARKVIWTYEASADLEAIAGYIARDSAFYAAAFVQEIRDASYSLNGLSGRGRVVPEFGNPNLRELFVREYRLIYSIEETRIIILALIHGKRDLKRLWEKEGRDN